VTNGTRIKGEKTAVGRIAAIARTLSHQMRQKNGREPDYADFRDAISEQMRQEFIRERIKEAKLCGRQDRVKALENMLDNGTAGV
jgi:hypothetical protein